MIIKNGIQVTTTFNVILLTCHTFYRTYHILCKLLFLLIYTMSFFIDFYRSNHQLVDIHGTKTYLIGGLTNELPNEMPKSPKELKKNENVQGIILPYILVSSNCGPFTPL